MPARTEVIRNVPTSQKPRLQKQYEDLGATVAWTEEPGGTWTLTATFPPARDAGAARGN